LKGITITGVDSLSLGKTLTVSELVVAINALPPGPGKARRRVVIRLGSTIIGTNTKTRVGEALGKTTIQHAKNRESSQLSILLHSRDVDDHEGSLAEVHTIPVNGEKAIMPWGIRRGEVGVRQGGTSGHG
jgi:hypothetical protein